MGTKEDENQARIDEAYSRGFRAGWNEALSLTNTNDAGYYAATRADPVDTARAALDIVDADALAILKPGGTS